ncbi:type II toxin-antitoxin system VapC family toxin [Gluconobacter oxydans]|uniref:Plasmid stability-like protein n=1 Tax=Gluconobacter oxydans (strain 621H) TaxID=290633 RepID=Q5HXY3_GLUOX|nr:type II toxin-antitoxin system VapC family toxin [Gluconobacter oxydans]AAW59620.1 Plasmid stability-like protein [Gluconobacter oxydans 621H]
MFLLDTNVVSELRKVRAGRADPNVARWAEQVEAETLFLSAITVMELDVGVMRIERRDPAQGSVLRNWLENYVLPEFSNRVLPVDLAVARRCAHLHVPDPGPERDTLIAATGLVHGMTVVTRNTDDFRYSGVPLLNPWKARHD